MMRAIVLATILSLSGFQSTVAEQPMEVVDVEEMAGSTESMASVQVVGPVVTQPLVADEGCPNGENRMSDLCAQWKAADAAYVAADLAKKSFYLTIIALFMSAIGTVAIIIALRDGRQTAQATVKALDIGRAMLTPVRTRVNYLRTINHMNEIEDERLVSRITWKNIGERPALDVITQCHLMAAPPGNIPDYPALFLNDNWKIVDAGEEITEGAPDVSGELVAPFLSEKADLYLLTLVRYRDRLNEDQVHTHRMYMRCTFDDFPPWHYGQSQAGLKLEKIIIRRPTINPVTKFVTFLRNAWFQWSVLRLVSAMNK